MIYCVDNTTDEPIMLINKHIGYDEKDGMGVDSSIFLNELLQLDTMNKKRIQVWINSPGGIVTGGYDIYSGILKTKTPVDTYCIGAAASIAGVIFQAGRKRIMMDFAWLMYHNPFVASGDKSYDPYIDVMKGSIVKMIEQKSGMNEDEVTKMMDRTTFINAAEALEMKLCDQVDMSATENTKYLRKITDVLQYHMECNKVLNSILNTNLKTDNMEGINLAKVTMRLNLNDSAPADHIVKAIDVIENRAIKAEADLLEIQNKAKTEEEKALFEKKKLENKIKELETSKATNEAELEDCKNKLTAMETDKKNAENKMLEEKAKNMVEGFAKAGRIKNEATVILNWTKLAVVNFEETQKMIEDLPLNKVANTIQEPNKLPEGAITTTAMNLAVMNKLRREGKLNK